MAIAGLETALKNLCQMQDVFCLVYENQAYQDDMQRKYRQTYKSAEEMKNKSDMRT